MIVDTSGYGAGIQVAGAENPEDRESWNQVGFYTGSDVAGLLDGLIQDDNLYVIDPPTLECSDGTVTKYACKWRYASYQVGGGQPTPGIKLEAESGVPSGGASIINDQNASGGRAVQF